MNRETYPPVIDMWRPQSFETAAKSIAASSG